MSHIHIHVLPGVPSTNFFLAYSWHLGQENLRCTTRLSFIIITESAPVHTVVGGLTAVVTFVKATEDTEETTGFANNAAELHIRMDFDDCVTELSA
jgi:hypothetical protein